MFGSYNDFHNRVHIDAFVVSSLDFMTSIIAGVATFSILGAISYETGVDIKEIASSGRLKKHARSKINTFSLILVVSS